MTSVLLISIPVQAQSLTQTTPGPLPSGVTPSLTVETLPYLSFSPNPVGVGQTFLVNLWLQPPIVVARQHIQAFLVTMTKPDGTKVTVGPMDSFQGDTTAWFEYIADQNGTWKIKFDFLGTYFPAGRYVDGKVVATGGTAYDSAYYKPSSTKELTLTVQQEQVMSWPPSPLPTDYWTRPISPENREWWVIGGNDPYYGSGQDIPGWPENTNLYRSNYQFTPFVQAPNTAHIAWRTSGALSGLFGGAYEQQSALVDFKGVANTFIGAAGPGSRGNPQIVYMGRCYTTITKPMPQLVNGTYRTIPTTVWECFDLRTGEVYWDITDATAPTIPHFEANVPAVPGAVHRVGGNVYLAAISGGRLIKYDPSFGTVSLNISIPVTSGTVYNDPFVFSVQTLSGTNYLIHWSIDGSSTDFSSRIISNITFPLSSIGTADYESMIAVTNQGINSNATGISVATRLIGVSLETGKVLWNVTTETTSGTQAAFSGSTAVADHGKYALRLNDGYWHCWDQRTGQQLWTSEMTSYPWGVFGAYDVQSAYGLLYYNQYDGIHAWDWETGKLVWSFHAPANPYETPYQGQYAWGTGAIIGDGKIYAYTCEHSPSSPVTRGWRIFCINATSGQGLWNITGPMCPGLIADGYLTATNQYDGYLYVFGKGKSSTTITAPQITISQGKGVILSGSVLDQSPAQPGTPCVSKESMSAWMEYLYMQKQIPADVIGVPVSLDALDPNGNSIHITTVTTDISGTFGYTWIPDIPGEYKVTATFTGDDSYGSSWAQTYVSTEDQAPEATATPLAQAATPPYEIYIVGSAIAVIIAVAIVGLILVRKKP